MAARRCWALLCAVVALAALQAQRTAWQELRTSAPACMCIGRNGIVGAHSRRRGLSREIPQIWNENEEPWHASMLIWSAS